MSTVPSLTVIRDDMHQSMSSILAFWMARGPDPAFDGFLTNMRGDGTVGPGPHDKYLNTQARLIWCFSALVGADDPRRGDALQLAGDGVAFLRSCFADPDHGGWYWKVDRAGHVVDDAKLTYGQSFALYALAAHARHAGDATSAALACDTFVALQTKAADNRHGGYYENLGRNWQPAAGPGAAGDRKSLDIHMHLLESFAELVRLTDDPVHHQRLREVRALIVDHMIDDHTGAGGNQCSLAFAPLVPIAIDKTWVAERSDGLIEPGIGTATMTTSYGHNLELAWLLGDADRTLGEPGASDAVIVRLAEHAWTFGHDHRRGGVYREGPLDGAATDRDKEFWQNAEALVGWLEAHRATGDDRYLDAFVQDWGFAQRHLIHPDLGEWRVRVAEDGSPLIDDLGNDWKVGYHTGRAALECGRRLDDLLAKER